MKIRLGSLEVRLSRYLALWSLVVVVFAMQGCVNDAVNARVWPPITYLRWSGVQWLTWAGLAPLVFRLGERHPLPFPLPLRALLRHVGYSIGVTLLAMAIGALVSSLFEPTGFGEQLWQFVSKHFATGVLAYWALLAVQQLLHFQAEKSRRELEATRLATELARSRLQVLKAQLQPHFLFNTLNAVSALVAERRNAEAQAMIARLGDFLRGTLAAPQVHEVPLGEEIAAAEDYLDIERARLGDRLRLRWQVGPDVLQARVPRLLLQPLLENAIRHGIAPGAGAGRLDITAMREGDRLRLEVNNDVSGEEGARDPDAGDSDGIGLRNLRERLQALYPDDHAFSAGAGGDGFRVALDLPWRERDGQRLRGAAP